MQIDIINVIVSLTKYDAKGICCNACTKLLYIWAVCGTKLSHRKSNISKAGFVDLYFVRDLEQ